MATFTPPALLLALQSLAAAELPAPAPATFMRALLPKLKVRVQLLLSYANVCVELAGSTCIHCSCKGVVFWRSPSVSLLNF